MTTISAFSVFAVIAILFFWSRAILRYKDRIISVWELMLWSGVWIGALLVVTSPTATDTIAARLGIGRGADVIVYASIILLFYLLFRIYIKIDILERQITGLVRTVAIRDAEAGETKK